MNLKVECHFVRDMLCGDNLNEIRVELEEIIADWANEVILLDQFSDGVMNFELLY